MKLAIKVMSNGNKQEMEHIKFAFLSKKTQLVNIINALKSKINNLNKEANHEVRVRDAMLHIEQKHTR